MGIFPGPQQQFLGPFSGFWNSSPTQSSLVIISTKVMYKFQSRRGWGGWIRSYAAVLLSRNGCGSPLYESCIAGVWAPMMWLIGKHGGEKNNQVGMHKKEKKRTKETHSTKFKCKLSTQVGSLDSPWDRSSLKRPPPLLPPFPTAACSATFYPAITECRVKSLLRSSGLLFLG